MSHSKQNDSDSILQAVLQKPNQEWNNRSKSSHSAAGILEILDIVWAVSEGARKPDIMSRYLRGWTFFFLVGDVRTENKTNLL
jgi:hypothetical protein